MSCHLCRGLNKFCDSCRIYSFKKHLKMKSPFFSLFNSYLILSYCVPFFYTSNKYISQFFKGLPPCCLGNPCVPFDIPHEQGHYGPGRFENLSHYDCMDSVKSHDRDFRPFQHSKVLHRPRLRKILGFISHYNNAFISIYTASNNF